MPPGTPGSIRLGNHEHKGAVLDMGFKLAEPFRGVTGTLGSLTAESQKFAVTLTKSTGESKVRLVKDRWLSHGETTIPSNSLNRLMFVNGRVFPIIQRGKPHLVRRGTAIHQVFKSETIQGWIKVANSGRHSHLGSKITLEKLPQIRCRAIRAHNPGNVSNI